MADMVMDHGSDVVDFPERDLGQNPLYEQQAEFLRRRFVESFLSHAEWVSGALDESSLEVLKDAKGDGSIVMGGYSLCLNGEPLFYFEHDQKVLLTNSRTKSTYFELSVLGEHVKPWFYETGLSVQDKGGQRGPLDLPRWKKEKESYLPLSRKLFGEGRSFFGTSLGCPIPENLVPYVRDFFERVSDGELRFGNLARPDGTVKFSKRVLSGGEHVLEPRTWGQSYLKETLEGARIEPSAIKGDNSSYLLFFWGDMAIMEPDVINKATYIFPREYVVSIKSRLMSLKELSGEEGVERYYHNDEESWKKRVSERLG